MKKLIQGIIEFRRNVREDYRQAFGKLATEQSPDTLFVACSDSRVVPNTFASTNPGDLFVLRNVGNIIPPCGHQHDTQRDESEPVTIEFSVLGLNISDIIICGHSECGAMRALINDRHTLQFKNMKHWLRHGDRAVEQLKAGMILDPTLSDHNQLSQINVLIQMEHVKSYPMVKKRIDEGTLAVHGWWFDISKADVYFYEDELKRFSIIDESKAATLLQRFKK